MSASGPPAPISRTRVASIDLIRGAVMILMAIDHVRVFSGIPAGGPTAGVFLTRWITHFCAPAFVFLAGTSAYLYGRRHADLPRFLVTRGVWLIAIELTVLRVAWTFNFDFRGYEMAGVIWVIGWSMIFLGALTKLPLAVTAAIGTLVIAGHNAFDGVLASVVPTLGDDLRGALWKIAYAGFFAGPIRVGPDGPVLHVLYTLIPWVGVIAAGYAFGKPLTLEPARRDRFCLVLGAGATALFLLLRGLDLYGDPRPWSAVAGPTGAKAMPALLSFLNTTKYPASLDFLLMTLGPTIAAIPLLERARGRLAGAVAVFGRVPFFFYVLHIPLIHALAIVVSLLRLGEVSPWLFADHPMGNPRPPEGYAWGLPLLYGVWLVAIVLLYAACRWFARVKATRSSPWLRYL
ncbi:MAG TPA: heparan-alpha-glucosaminide N-acetyltransferase domain-containing protein [Candidatus Polarisedimenticolaceae bacterium]|nr:heparan-alpha-glucosaminide N-acetyltransferase domain-containing protein [Candidatus Polarisedimenticolaceae bacterium]